MPFLSPFAPCRRQKGAKLLCRRQGATGSGQHIQIGACKQGVHIAWLVPSATSTVFYWVIDRSTPTRAIPLAVGQLRVPENAPLFLYKELVMVFQPVCLSRLRANLPFCPASGVPRDGGCRMPSLSGTIFYAKYFALSKDFIALF